MVRAFQSVAIFDAKGLAEVAERTNKFRPENNDLTLFFI